MKKSDIKKMIVIGLDGFTFDVLDPYISKGMLPNMRRMISQGVRGTLESAIPPVTGPSWVSFMTGMGPGKHGIYDFVKPGENTIKRRAISYKDIKVPTIWEYFNEAKQKIGIVNLPITYPPPEVDGFIIPGLLTPNTTGEFAYPYGLMGELRKAIGEYVFDVWWQHYGESGVDKFIKELIHCTEQRIKAILYLMEKKQWDIFMGVFIGTDRIQHYIWQFIHPANTATFTSGQKALVSRVAEFYSTIDHFLGQVIDGYGDNANMFIISDHGFGPLRGKFYINRWLEGNGYLSVHKTQAHAVSLKKKILGLARLMVRGLDPWELRKKLGIRFSRPERMSAYDFLDAIDWSKTSAYSASNTEQGIYLNVKGREPMGTLNKGEDYLRVRDEIIGRLNMLKDPDTNEKINVQIYKRENIYRGPYVENAPDIVLFLENGERLLDVQLREILYEEAGWHTGFGTHRLDGVFIAHGPDIRKGMNITGAGIMDIAPTLLHHQGLSIPEDMDGRLLQEIFTDEYVKKHPASYIHLNARHPRENGEGHEMSDSDLNDVEEKLKGLGYL